MVHLHHKPGIGFAFILVGSFGMLILTSLNFGQTAFGGFDGSQMAPGQERKLLKVSLHSPDECGSQAYPRLLLEEHVETGSPGWAHGGLFDQWEISSWKSHDGTYAWYASAPAYSSDQSLFSPSIALPVNESPLTLRFWHYHDIESSYAGCHDGALLEISTNDGQSWTQLIAQLLTDPYDGIIETGSNNPLGGRSAWCGHSQDWFESIVALDEFAGQTVRVRFRLGTNSSQSREGWYLDGLAVQSCPSAYVASLSAESRQSGMPGDPILHHFRLENLGLDDQYTFQLKTGIWPAVLLTPADWNLSSGEIFTASVRVDLPASPGGQIMEDNFQLEAVSAGNPNQVLQSTGISSLNNTPGLSLISDQSLQEGKPGETITHTFSLTNTGDTVDNFQIWLEEAEWSTIVSQHSGLLQPGQSTSIPAQVTVPVGPLKSAEMVITDTLKLKVSSGWASGIWAEAISTTSADLIAGLWIGAPTLLDALAGRPLQAQFYITNLGNFADRYLLEWQGDWLAEPPDSQTDWIAPGDQGKLLITILTPPQTPAGEISVIILKAKSQLDPSKKSQLFITVYNRNRLFLPLIRQ